MQVQPMYGGAMQMALPNNFIDTSLVRQVPDNQEVWVDADTNQSAILEILEVVPDKTGEELVRYHFEELGLANKCTKDEMRVVATKELVPEDLKNLEGMVTTAFALSGEQFAQKFNESESKNVVNIEMCVIRLCPPMNADLLLSVNTPIKVNPKSSDASLNTACTSFFVDTVKSLKLNDPGLFA
eukprot:TRINITY_DN34960_c0_g1_i1.p1 TRINITY_DN34960_c0_g1~~TRINITY_DN34960_c0_g1_i1.p1  ORF type:complete len:184 (+),score=22.33 TRINITY_DN34960_c0_g1_i1:41-592(+)